MPLWGNTDQANDAPNWATSYVNLPANSVNQATLYGNTTVGAFENNGEPMNKAVGTFGVVADDVGSSNASVESITVQFAGSGYSAAPTVTIDGNATATANLTSGHLNAITVTSGGSGYSTAPDVTIAAPTAKSFSANAVVAADDFIPIATSPFVDGDVVTYTVAVGNTALDNLTSGDQYNVVGANSTGVKLSLTPGGAPIDLSVGGDEAGHSLTGQTATASADLTGFEAGEGSVHPGWVLRTEGTGGRAGRVTYETLVAMRGMKDA